MRPQGVKRRLGINVIRTMYIVFEDYIFITNKTSIAHLKQYFFTLQNWEFHKQYVCEGNIYITHYLCQIDCDNFTIKLPQIYLVLKHICQKSHKSKLNF